MKPLECEKCKDTFKTEKSLHNHLSIQHKEDIYTCEICSRTYVNKGDYTDHLKKHGTDSIKYECPQCPCFFKNPGHLRVHVKEVHKKLAKTFMCKICRKPFDSRHGLTKHKEKSHGNSITVFNCKYCDRPYRYKNSLKWHVTLNHNKDFERSKCPYCPCDFKWPHHLKVHIRKVHIDKGYTPADLLKRGLTSIRRKTNDCVVCKKDFEKKFDLMMHLRNDHKQELDIYKCCQCDACFSISNSLVIHLGEHKRKNGVSTHKCDQCFPEFAPKLYLEPVVSTVEDDGRTDIEKEVIDFEISLMENEDIREMLKSKIRHAKRKPRASKIDGQLDGGNDDLTVDNFENNVDEQELHVEENELKYDETSESNEAEAKAIEDVDLKTPSMDISNQETKVEKELRICVKRLELPLNYKCNECCNTYSTQSELDSHVIGCQPVNEKYIPPDYKCDLCKDTFATEDELKIHKTKHRKPQRNIKCKLCKIVLKKSNYERHLKEKHNNLRRKDRVTLTEMSPKKSQEPIRRKVVKERLYECGKCRIYFSNKLELLRHISDEHMRLSSPLSPETKTTDELSA